MKEVNLENCKQCPHKELCKGHYDYYQDGVHITSPYTLDECRAMKKELESIDDIL